ncbi:MAG: hypothetical protein HY720_19170 [Planctomycetes bacterium]|nr:hypothetical protein [Planctomycetota bacterium]
MNAERRLDRENGGGHEPDELLIVVGNLAHELNNLLQLIFGYTQCAQDGLDPDEARHHDLAEVLRATGRATELARHLQVLSHGPERGEIGIDLDLLLRQSAERLRPLLGERFALELALGGTGRLIAGDPRLIERAVFHLIANARDAMPEGGHISISTQEAPRGGTGSQDDSSASAERYFSLSITDSGTGFPPEIRSRIGEPFLSTRPGPNVRGLGLSIVKGIVRRHRGTLDIESPPAGGTTVRCTFPVWQAGGGAGYEP